MIQITKDTLPQVKERYPFIYLEKGRLEVDDCSIEWIDSECHIVPIPIATVLCILLGPGTSITHEAIKVISSENCTICWVGTDSMLYFATGKSPTSDTRNMVKQACCACDQVLALEVAKRMYASRFPKIELEGKKSIKELMGMEGLRVRATYEEMARKYRVGWTGRQYVPGKFEMSSTTNKILTAANTALYALLLSIVSAIGYSPYIGFIHTGSPLPFIYDLADVYKEQLTIDLAFSLTKELAGREYDRTLVSERFRQRVLESGLLETAAMKIDSFFKGLHNGSRNYK